MVVVVLGVARRGRGNVIRRRLHEGRLRNRRRCSRRRRFLWHRGLLVELSDAAGWHPLLLVPVVVQDIEGLVAVVKEDLATVELPFGIEVGLDRLPEVKERRPCLPNQG